MEQEWRRQGMTIGVVFRLLKINVDWEVRGRKKCSTSEKCDRRNS